MRRWLGSAAEDTHHMWGIRRRRSRQEFDFGANPSYIARRELANEDLERDDLLAALAFAARLARTRRLQPVEP